MKLTSSILLAGAAASAAQTCTKITDPASPMSTYLAQATGAAEGNAAAQQAITAGLAALPDSVSTCIGSIDPKSALTSLTGAVGKEPTCATALTWLMAKAPSASTPAPSAANASSDPLAMLAFTDAEAQAYCTPITQSLMPCYNKALAPALASLVSSTPCCADFSKDVSALFGETLDVMLKNLVNKIVDVGCSIQTPGFSSPNQTCAYSLVHSAIGNAKSLPAAGLNLLNLVQIPNDQGCAAIEGNPFTTTTGTTVSNAFTKPVVPGACAKPVDALLTYFRGFPVLKTLKVGGIQASDLLADKTCVSGALVKDALKDIKFDAQTKTMVDLVLTNATCFHLANGYSSSCTTVSKLAATASGGSDATGTTPAPKTSSAPVVVGSLATAALVALMA